MEITDIRQLLSADLTRFEQHFARTLDLIPTGLAAHLSALRGKRLRPLVLMLVARAIAPKQPLKDSHYDIAAIIELIHNATLIHDDVLDEAKLRRNKQTFRSNLGNEMAVLFGDYLFSRAFVGCSLVNSQPVLKLLSSVAAQMCLGELRHMHKRFDFAMAEAEYFRVIRHKTASLFAAAAYLGAYLTTGNSRIINAANNFGEHFGTAYQVMDDYMDIASATRRSDKSAGTDLSEGKITLPVIRMLKTTDNRKKNQLIRLISHDGLAMPKRHRALYDLLTGNGAMDYTYKYITGYVNKAKTVIAPFRESIYKQALVELSDKIVPPHS